MQLDNQTFQLLTLALLGLTILALLVVLLSLGRVRALARRSAERLDSLAARLEEAGAAPAGEPAGAASPLEEAAPTSAAESRPETAPAEVTAETPAAAGAPGTEVGPGEHAGAGPATTAWEPVSAAGEEATAGKAVAEEPQEQPFERDGRWYYRRGDELLVYDEQTGQWVQAPEQPARAAAPTPEPRPQAATFWKCPNCGAVNGSTATACRMCFTPRS